MLDDVVFLFCCSRTSENELGQYVFQPNHCPDPLTENKWICPIILVLEAGIEFSHVPLSNEYPFLKNFMQVFFPKQTHCEKRLKVEVNDLLILCMGGKSW